MLETSKIIVCLAVKTQYTRDLLKRFTLFSRGVIQWRHHEV